MRVTRRTQAVAGVLLLAAGLFLLGADRASTAVVTIDLSGSTESIGHRLTGATLSYTECGAGAWDRLTATPIDEVLRLAQDMGVTMLRFPGGLVGTAYHFIDGIGPVSERPQGTSGADGAPVSNAYGFIEHMTLVERLGIETTVVVNFGTGTPQEAAAWVAYANGRATDVRPIGTDATGRDWGSIGDWAAQRTADQTAFGIDPHSYGILYWEVGSDVDGERSFSWTHNATQYAEGGIAAHVDEPLGQGRAFDDRASVSDGIASQSYRTRYTPILSGSLAVSIDDETWEPVLSLFSEAPDAKVYVIDEMAGEVRFGDGVHGAIPSAGSVVRGTYVSGPHAGFDAFAKAMKEVDPHVLAGSSFHEPEALSRMSSDALDFVALRLIDGPQSSNGAPEDVYLDGMAVPLRIGRLLTEVRDTLAAMFPVAQQGIELLATAYRPYAELRDPVALALAHSLGSSLATLDLLRVFAERGVAAALYDSLLDGSNGALIGPGPDYERRSESYALELFGLLESDRLPLSWDARPAYERSSGSETLDVPYVEALATRNPETGRIAILLVNKHPSEAIEVTIRLTWESAPLSAALTRLAGASLDDAATLSTETWDIPDDMQISLPPASATLVSWP